MDGILLLDKPPGISSNQALQVVRRALGAAKGGHTGTLDVAASGLLPLCFGEATKVSQFLLEADKRYQAVIRLGVVTTTGDAEGEIVIRCPVPSGVRSELPRALDALRGPQTQVPPMYSALKHQGRPLYRLARAGVEVERAPRNIIIHDIALVGWQGEEPVLDIHCSKGTYIRTLAVRLGELLGCGASLGGLRRLVTGPFDLSVAHPLDYFRRPEATPEVLEELLLPTDAALAAHPLVELDADAAQRLCQGQPVGPVEAPAGALVRVYGPARGFLGMGEVDDARCLRPRRLMAP